MLIPIKEESAYTVVCHKNNTWQHVSIFENGVSVSFDIVTHFVDDSKVVFITEGGGCAEFKKAKGTESPRREYKIEHGRLTMRAVLDAGTFKAFTEHVLEQFEDSPVDSIGLDPLPPLTR